MKHSSPEMYVLNAMIRYDRQPWNFNTENILHRYSVLRVYIPGRSYGGSDVVVPRIEANKPRYPELAYPATTSTSTTAKRDKASARMREDTSERRGR